MARGRQVELTEEERGEAAALVARLKDAPWRLSLAAIGAKSAEAVGRPLPFSGEAVRQAAAGAGGAEILAALRALAGSAEQRADADDDVPSDPTADGRWKRRASKDSAFRAVATRARGLAATDRDRRVVETALDIAHDELPKNYGGLGVGEAQRAYERALAFMRGEVDTPAVEPEAQTQEAPPVATPKLADTLAAAKSKVKKR